MIIKSISKPKRGRTLSSKINKASDNIFELLQVTCHICAHPYNSTDQIPITLCPEQHTYCSKCVTDLFAHHPYGTRCPTCRVYICQKGTQVNKSILRICDILPTLASQFAHLELQKQELQTRLNQIQKTLQRNRLNHIPLQDRKQNINQNQNYNDKPTKKLPSISNREPPKKDQKINIHSYLARRRKFSTKENSKKENVPELSRNYID